MSSNRVLFVEAVPESQGLVGRLVELANALIGLYIGTVVRFIPKGTVRGKLETLQTDRGRWQSERRSPRAILVYSLSQLLLSYSRYLVPMGLPLKLSQLTFAGGRLRLSRVQGRRALPVARRPSAWIPRPAYSWTFSSAHG